MGIVYGQPQGAGKKSKQKHSGGITGFTRNFLHDVEDAGLGFFPGLIALGQAGVHDAGKALGLAQGQYQLDNIGSAIADQYKQLYSPLIHGDFAGFGHKLYAHPLQPILDAATLVTGGGAAAGRLGTIAAKAGAEGSALERIGLKAAGLQKVRGTALSPEDLIHPALGAPKAAAGKQLIALPRITTSKLTGEHHVVGPVSHNPVIRARGRALDKISENLPQTSYGSVERRAERSTRRTEDQHIDRAIASAQAGLRRAAGNLKKNEKAAFHLAAQGFNTPERLDKYVAYRESQLAKMSKLEEGAPPAAARPHIEFELSVARHPAVREAVESLANPKSRLSKSLDQARVTQAAIDELIVSRAAKDGPGSADLARKMIEDRRAAPYSIATGEMPDAEMASKLVTVSHHVDAKRMGGDARNGYKPAAKPGELHKSQFINFANAMFERSPGKILDSHTAILKYVKRQQRFDRVLASARPVSQIEHFDPNKWHLINDPKLDKYVANIHRFLTDDAKPMLGHDTPELQHLTKQLENLIQDRGGEALAIPKGQYRELVGEFRRANSAVRNLIDKPTTLYKNLLLQYRPAWLVNNLVSQVMLLGASHPLGQFRASAELLGSKNARRETLAAAPELQNQGFFASQSAQDAGVLGRSLPARAFQKGAELSGKVNTVLSDNVPRLIAMRAEANLVAKKYMAAKRAAGEPITRREAISHVLSNEAVVDHLARKVAKEQIDFNSLTPLERDIMRRLIPFYVWTSRITHRTLDMVLNEPEKVLAASDLGEEYVRDLEKQLGGAIPSFTKGNLVLGRKGNVARILSTAGYSPTVTPADVFGMIGSSVLPGEAPTAGQNPLNQFNPYATAFIAAAQNKSPFTGQPISRDNSDSLAVRYGKQLVGSTPLARLISTYRLEHDKSVPKGSFLYKPSFLDALSGFAGFPFKDMSVDRAHYKAYQEKYGKQQAAF